MSTPTADELLGIYLRDHHAAGSAGVALARRAADNTELIKSRETLAAVAAEIEQDLASLEEIMASLGVTPSATKDRIATVGERVGRLKLNGRLLQRSTLSNVLELEALVAGISAKEALWWSLSESDHGDDTELKRLIDRARRQRTLVERCRRKAARMAFEVSG